jgi:GTPase SAR1 family protein
VCHINWFGYLCEHTSELIPFTILEIISKNSRASKGRQTSSAAGFERESTDRSSLSCFRLRILFHRPATDVIDSGLMESEGLLIVLVGCKSDLRTDGKTIEELAKTSQKLVSREQGRKVSKKIGVY